MDSSMRWVTLALILFLSCTTIAGDISVAEGGNWELLLNSSGVVAMHMALTHYDTVIIFDQTTYGRSGLLLPPDEPCSDDDDDDHQCWAHSVEYNIASNTIRPLSIKTDPWCSSGAFLSDGTLAQTGGHRGGTRSIRYFHPCYNNKCGWSESQSKLADGRWYATTQILPEDRLFVVGGRDVFTYEFVPKSDDDEGSFDLHLLEQTYNEEESGNNLYPIVHLSSDGNLFIFANRDSILLNYHTNEVIKRFPSMPGIGSRSYPNTGSSVMLPLDYADGFHRVEIMICGGGSPGAFRAAKDKEFLRGESSCGRMVITNVNPQWAMEEMPGPRLMNDMIILPTGDILIINGAMYGSAGWERATEPSLNPYLYKPYLPAGLRFSVLSSSIIPRMYHSSAILLPDGRILVAGSNPTRLYTFKDTPYPTELRVEAFIPYYMDQSLDDRRPRNVMCHHNRDQYGVRYGEEFIVRFELATEPGAVEFHVYAPPFATHSLSMNQRMLRLWCTDLGREINGRMRAVLVAPPSPVAAPMGYYLLTVVNQGIPSTSGWVRFIQA